MQQTNQYQFNLIESGDHFSTEPLNENAEKMEEALLAQAQTIEAAKAAGLQVHTGTYTGTGKYGSNNKNTLTFPFSPLIVFITQKDSGGHSAVWLQGITNGRTYVSNDSTASATITWGSKNVSWYYTSAAYQLNETNKVYTYLALGFN